MVGVVNDLTIGEQTSSRSINYIPLPRMMVRDARIRLRLAELRVMVAETAIEFWLEQWQRELASTAMRARSAMKRGNGQRRE
jgi:hypothetical protein